MNSISYIRHSLPFVEFNTSNIFWSPRTSVFLWRSLQCLFLSGSERLTSFEKLWRTELLNERIPASSCWILPLLNILVNEFFTGVSINTTACLDIFISMRITWKLVLRTCDHFYDRHMAIYCTWPFILFFSGITLLSKGIFLYGDHNKVLNRKGEYFF